MKSGIELPHTEEDKHHEEKKDLFHRYFSKLSLEDLHILQAQHALHANEAMNKERQDFTLQPSGVVFWKLENTLLGRFASSPEQAAKIYLMFFGRVRNWLMIAPMPFSSFVLCILGLFQVPSGYFALFSLLAFTVFLVWLCTGCDMVLAKLMWFKVFVQTMFSVVASVGMAACFNWDERGWFGVYIITLTLYMCLLEAANDFLLPLRFVTGIGIVSLVLLVLVIFNLGLFPNQFDHVMTWGFLGGLSQREIVISYHQAASSGLCGVAVLCIFDTYNGYVGWKTNGVNKMFRKGNVYVRDDPKFLELLGENSMPRLLQPYRRKIAARHFTGAERHLVVAPTDSQQEEEEVV